MWFQLDISVVSCLICCDCWSHTKPSSWTSISSNFLKRFCSLEGQFLPQIQPNKIVTDLYPTDHLFPHFLKFKGHCSVALRGHWINEEELKVWTEKGHLEHSVLLLSSAAAPFDLLSCYMSGWWLVSSVLLSAGSPSVRQEVCSCHRSLASYGAPQGSVLGPIRFFRFTCLVVLTAGLISDDTQLYFYSSQTICVVLMPTMPVYQWMNVSQQTEVLLTVPHQFVSVVNL